jgi:hypothetical protein
MQGASCVGCTAAESVQTRARAHARTHMRASTHGGVCGSLSFPSTILYSFSVTDPSSSKYLHSFLIRDHF